MRGRAAADYHLLGNAALVCGKKHGMGQAVLTGTLFQLIRHLGGSHAVFAGKCSEKISVFGHGSLLWRV